MARKQSSSRLSTIAARTMARVQSSRRSFKAMGLKPPRLVNVRTTDVVALCMSVLSQDETRGQKKFLAMHPTEALEYVRRVASRHEARKGVVCG